MSMSTEPVSDLIPARMLNEYAYYPRLCWIEWVEGEFADSADTVDGTFQHRRVDRESDKLPEADRGGQDAAGEDRILSFTLGAAESYNANATLAVGRPYVFVERNAIVV